MTIIVPEYGNRASDYRVFDSENYDWRDSEKFVEWIGELLGSYDARHESVMTQTKDDLLERIGEVGSSTEVQEIRLNKAKMKARALNEEL